MRLTDVTSQWACFALWGPKAGEILAPLTPDPLDFRITCRCASWRSGTFRSARSGSRSSASSDWELYCPTEYGAGLWRTLWEAGRAHELVAGGYRAIDSMRLEKGYRVWGADITPDETPLEARLGFCVRDERTFIGAEALAEPERRCDAWCSRILARWRSATSRCGSTARSAAA